MTSKPLKSTEYLFEAVCFHDRFATTLSDQILKQSDAMAAAAQQPRDIATIWAELSGGLDTIYKTQEKVPPQRYMDLYT